MDQSTVASRQKLCVVASVFCVLALPTAANYFLVSDELWRNEVSFGDPVA
jgi:hypothetical protein